jgi:hypothetical protein
MPDVLDVWDVLWVVSGFGIGAGVGAAIGWKLRDQRGRRWLRRGWGYLEHANEHGPVNGDDIALAFDLRRSGERDEILDEWGVHE